MSRRYPQAYDGDKVYPAHKGFRLACCDCGLIHQMDFRVETEGARNIVSFRIKRLNRNTAAHRRKPHSFVQRGKK